MTSVYGQSLPVQKQQPDTAPDHAVGTDCGKRAEGWFPLQTTIKPIYVDAPRYEAIRSLYHPCPTGVLRKLCMRKLDTSLRPFATIRGCIQNNPD
jgi:hypothetical protein